MKINAFTRHGIRLLAGFVLAASVSVHANAQERGFPNVEVSLQDLGDYVVRTNADVPIDRIEAVDRASLAGDFTKDDVQNELGRPTEGGSETGNWYYVYNLDSRSGDKLACQYRVSFKYGDLQSTAWRRSQCQTAYKEMLGLVEQDVDLSVNVQFGFNSETLTPTSKSIIQSFIAKANKQLDAPKFQVKGHADSIGSASYNEALAQRRAQAVLQEMRYQGVSTFSVAVEAVGSREPLANCSNLARQDAVGCNSPNRRVSIGAVE